MGVLDACLWPVPTPPGRSFPKEVVGPVTLQGHSHSLTSIRGSTSLQDGEGRGLLRPIACHWDSPHSLTRTAFFKNNTCF